MKIHHPPHILIDDTFYFITARTYQKQNIFNTDNRKSLLLDSLKAEFRKNTYSLMAWVILDNHYHVLFQADKAEKIPKILNLIHGRVSFQINSEEKIRGRKIFQNYWDRGIRDEQDYWKHFNYIHHNPIKHGYTRRMEEYEFSSYNYWLDKMGAGWINSCFKEYPIIDFTPHDV